GLLAPEEPVPRLVARTDAHGSAGRPADGSQPRTPPVHIVRVRREERPQLLRKEVEHGAGAPRGGDARIVRGRPPRRWASAAAGGGRPGPLAGAGGDRGRTDRRLYSIARRTAGAAGLTERGEHALHPRRRGTGAGHPVADLRARGADPPLDAAV